MARHFPKFLYSAPTNTKSIGPFVVHTLNPYLLCRISKSEGLIHDGFETFVFNEYAIIVVDADCFVNDTDNKDKRHETISRMFNWLNHNDDFLKQKI